jgi:hypothetical protein
MSNVKHMAIICREPNLVKEYLLSLVCGVNSSWLFSQLGLKSCVVMRGDLLT